MGGPATDRMNRVSGRLRRLPGEGVKDAAGKVRKAAINNLRRDAGADRKLSGLGRNGRPQTVRTVRRNTSEIYEARVMAGPPRQRAPWFWLEEGTEPGARRIRGTSRRYRPGGGTQMFNHPGTKPKRTWSKAVVPALDEVRTDFEREFRKALRG